MATVPFPQGFLFVVTLWRHRRHTLSSAVDPCWTYPLAGSSIHSI